MDWPRYWTTLLPALGEPTAPELLASDFVRHRAPEAIRSFWERARSWGEPDLRLCLADVAHAQRHTAPLPGGFTFGHNYGDREGWRGLFLDVDGYAGRGPGAVLAWVPKGNFEHLYLAAPSLEALVDKARAGKRLRLKALGAVQAAELAKALKAAGPNVASAPPTVHRPADTLLGGGASNALSWLYSVVGSLEIPARGVRVHGSHALTRCQAPSGHRLGEDAEASYVVTRASMGQVDGRLVRVPREGEPEDLGYLLDVLARWVREA